MKQTYEKLIEYQDNSLMIARELWMNSTGEEREKFRAIIDKQLDMRIELMKKRDAE